MVYCTKNKITTSNEQPSYHCNSCGPLGTTYYGSDYVYDINRNLLAKVGHHGANDGKLWLSGQYAYGVIDNIDTVSAQSAIFSDDIDDRNLLPFKYENATDLKNGIVALCKDGK